MMTLDLDPEAVLKNTWLWDEKTIKWAEAVIAARKADKKQDKQPEVQP